MSDFSGKVVVITGAASGMGAATALEMAGRGATLVLIDLNGAQLDHVADSCRGAGALVTTAVGDVGDSAFCDEAIDTAAEAHGSIDVLVTAAGTIRRADALGTTDADWREVMSVNVDGVFHSCRAALRHMVRAGTGAIVNFGSVWGGLGSTNALAYTTSKGAVHNLTRSLALDHAGDGVRVNAVAPGEINTPMLSSHRGEDWSDADLSALTDGIPIGRLGNPSEIAKVVAFLASDDASYMTGEIVHVDGGYAAQ